MLRDAYKWCFLLGLHILASLFVAFRPPTNELSIHVTLKSKSGNAPGGTVLLRDGHRVLAGMTVSETNTCTLTANPGETIGIISLSFAQNGDTTTLERFDRLPAQEFRRSYTIP